MDAVVCALALVHVPDLASAFAEFARVLRSGGRILISDVHPCLIMLGWQAQFTAEHDRRGYMRLHGHLVSDYITAARQAGLILSFLREQRVTEEAAVTPAASIIPEANRAAFVGLPGVVVYEFQQQG